LVGYVGKGVPLNSPADLGVIEAATMLRARQLSSAERTDACLRRIEPPAYAGSSNWEPNLAAQQRRAAGTAAWEHWFGAHGV
jgi:hypothetical protein